jgi:hypothetical protein
MGARINPESCRALWMALAIGGFALPAAAQDESSCETHADCEHGYSCEVVGASGCARPACAEGEDCPVTDCQEMEWKECVISRDCEEDSDCLDGWACNRYEREACTDAGEAPPCQEGDDCKQASAADRVPDCTSETVRVCEPPWAGACEEDADCGAGFECVELIAGTCSVAQVRRSEARTECVRRNRPAAGR